VRQNAVGVTEVLDDEAAHVVAHLVGIPLAKIGARCDPSN
jgi:hypothetical protein